ncbi:hypothetical protein [Sphingomonas sp. R86521]|uniref:hypothetical protein n=1 Tax=Sphingomonas sp. R86521 TaxID=3093860 RepID=UPI0036D2D9E4
MVPRIILAALMLTANAAHAQRAELPVRLVDLPNGDRRFSTTLTIDGRPVEVGIDTGSTGLRVLPRGLGDQAADSGPRVAYSYGSGTAFEGRAVVANVAAGTIARPVTLMRITSVGCTARHPDCPVAHMDLPTYGIQGDGIPGQGFAAILGIRLERDAIDNPFEQLGVRRWIIDLPRTADAVGRIVLNPDDAELAGYARLAVDGDGTTPGCLIGPQKICGRAIFDTGASGLRVIRAAPFRPWPNDTAITVTVGTGATVTQGFAATTGRRDQATKLLYEPGGADTRLSLGFAPYFRWSVLYDPEHHQIGVKTR